MDHVAFITCKLLQLIHGNIQYLFDYWVDPVVHLILPATLLHGLANKKTLIEEIEAGNVPHHETFQSKAA